MPAPDTGEQTLDSGKALQKAKQGFEVYSLCLIRNYWARIISGLHGKTIAVHVSPA